MKTARNENNLQTETNTGVNTSMTNPPELKSHS